MTLSECAELGALTMLLRDHSKCTCGFMAEGHAEVNGNPVCVKCWPEAQKGIAIHYRVHDPSMVWWVPFPHAKVAARFNALLRSYGGHAGEPGTYASVEGP